MLRLIGRITVACALLGAVGSALAQNTFPTPAGSAANGSVVMCPSTASAALKVPCDAANPLAVSASVSASIVGFPTAQSTGTPISVTTGGVSGTLPTGAVVVATNVGTTNAAYCKLGASATTSDQYIAPSGGWFAFTVGASTQLTCITSTSTTTVNMVGGSGLPTGTGGGGGGGGGGGAVTIASGAVASGAYSSGSVASGAFASGSIGSGAVASGAFASGSVASGALAAGSMVDLLTMRGTKAPGTAAANSELVGGLYTLSPFAMTDGQQAALQFSYGGNVKTRPGSDWAAATTWTTATAANTNLVLFCGDSSPAVLVDIVGSGTITTGIITFQYANDATDCSGTTGTFASLPAAAVVSQYPFGPVTNPLTLTTGQTAINLLPGATRVVRARLTTAITGSGGQVIINTTVSSSNPIVNSLLNPLAAGTSVIGKFGIDQTTPGTTDSVTVKAGASIQAVGGATGGNTTTGNIGANNTTAVVVKASAGTLYGAQLGNIGSVPAYLKIYNATSATCGSGTPVKRLIIPKSGTAADGAGSNVHFGDVGVAFGTGITYCLTAGIADNDTTAPAAATVLVNLDWK